MDLPVLFYSLLNRYFPNGHHNATYIIHIVILGFICYIIHIVIVGKLSYQSDLKSWIVWIGSAALNT